ncbi:hypothetical protein CJ030_MR4G023079 [Morella rubra]|uniref:Uncharacterized protein n=1 Tax=Morella rubra TaxID=262757 RepID=A0A6A1VY69_9ROSI|nr:hypothetical protein CJ030_MR4G023079 [Morella rubra]
MDKEARLRVDLGSSSRVHVDPKLERAANHRRLMNMYASTISQYGNAPELWEVFQCYHTALADEVAKLTCSREPCELEVAADRAISDDALEMGAKGWKTREPKHRGNKWLKSALEGKKQLKHQGDRKCGAITLSQPVACHLLLEDEPEVSSEDELLSQLGKYRSLKDL